MLGASIEPWLLRVPRGAMSRLRLLIYRGLGMSYNRDPSFGLIIYRILDTQLADGSWKTNPLTEDAPGCQTDYLRLMYSATWACLDALRPLRSDILDPENEALSLV